MKGERVKWREKQKKKKKIRCDGWAQRRVETTNL